MKIMLTDRAMKAMKPAPPGTRKMIWDAAVPSFGVRVSEHGKLTFVVMRRLNGRLLRRSLGQYPIMPLAVARKAALSALRDISEGIDPKQKKAAERRAQARREANSFASVAEQFIARHVRKLRSAAEIEAAIRRELIGRWGDKPIAEISRRDVIALVEGIADPGHRVMARKVFAFAGKLFNWALARELVEHSPCGAVRISELTGKQEPRQRVLSDAEIRALWQATGTLGYPAQPFVRLLLLTGQRLREVAEAKWNEFDFEKALWTIPPERMKGDAAHEVPLAAMAVEILKGLPLWAGGDFVFSTTGGERPISSFSKMKLRVDAAMAEPIAAWRFHDLRRTLRTGLGALPVPTNVAELCVAHAQPGLHKIYDRHGYRDEKRRAFELWATRLRDLVEPREVLVTLPRRA
jgi:integrase